jgi:diguanylate cyclase (GGDEF)-like protein
MDNFKHINDTYGHLIGDQMLRHFGEICREFLPESALLARYGGDEFVFLLCDYDLTEANKYAETLRQLLSRIQVQIGQDKITLQASLGIARFHPHIHDLDTLLAQADAAMYLEKKKKGVIFN